MPAMMTILENVNLEQTLNPEEHAPSRLEFLQRVVKMIETDLTDVKRILEYADDRVFKNKHLPSTKKVLSLSDGSAAYIQKGCRTPAHWLELHQVRHTATGRIITRDMVGIKTSESVTAGLFSIPHNHAGLRRPHDSGGLKKGDANRIKIVYSGALIWSLMNGFSAASVGVNTYISCASCMYIVDGKNPFLT